MNNRNLCLAGAGLIIIGLFLPIVRLPIVGSINMFSYQSSLTGILILVAAAIAGFLAFQDKTAKAIWPFAAAGLLIAITLVRLQWRISTMKSEFAEELEGNPFRGIAEGFATSIQLEWGWIVLVAGVGIGLYAAYQQARAEEAPAFRIEDQPTKLLAAATAILLIIGLAPIGYNAFKSNLDTRLADAAEPSQPAFGDDEDTQTSVNQSDDEKKAYISSNLELYDIEAKYYDSMLDGRVPGVDFKIKNKGDRTLDRVEVTFFFQDADGNTIAEEDYSPVLVSEYSFAGDNKPLRPNYIWQQEHDKFFQAPNVPTEWKAGAVTARITDIEFGPDES